MNALAKQITQAKNKLIADGWTHIASVMHDGPGDKFGLQFLKAGQVIYLNKNTVSQYLN